MGKKWDEKKETAEIQSWVRSWRQELFTELGSNFRFVAHMEKVRTMGTDVLLGREPLGMVSVTGTDCQDDPVLKPLADNLQDAMIALVEELRKLESAKSNKANKKEIS